MPQKLRHFSKRSVRSGFFLLSAARTANPDDKRSTLIVLTEKGKARAWEVQDDRRKAAEEFCSKLTEEEKDTLIALLDKLLERPACCGKQAES